MRRVTQDQAHLANMASGLRSGIALLQPQQMMNSLAKNQRPENPELRGASRLTSRTLAQESIKVPSVATGCCPESRTTPTAPHEGTNSWEDKFVAVICNLLKAKPDTRPMESYVVMRNWPNKHELETAAWRGSSMIVWKAPEKLSTLEERVRHETMKRVA